MAWFDDAFGPWYLKLYAHRDREEAARTFLALDPWLPQGGRMLDVACGMGRHLDILIGRGVPAVGLDRSARLLDCAPASLRPYLVRGDMRQLPFPDRVFGVLFSFFTSFGYFGSRTAHRALLSEFARVVEPKGRLVLDVSNAPYVRESLVRSSRRVVDGHEIQEDRAILDRKGESVVIKSTRVADGAGREVASFREEVSLYDREELLGMLGEAGWRETISLGDYDGRPWTAHTQRLLVLAERGKA
jgi:SAM-dependent methyltransferase